MNLDLTDEEVLALVRLLRDAIGDDRYPLSPRILTLKRILAKLDPQPVHEPLPPPKGVCATARNNGQEATPRVKSEPGPPMTLGAAAAAGVRLIDSAENAQQEEDGSSSNEPNAERLRFHSAIPRARNVLPIRWVGSLRIRSKKSSEEELCYAAAETQLKGKGSKQSCIRGRNRRRLFGVIDQRIDGGYTAAKYDPVSGPQPG